MATLRGTADVDSDDGDIDASAPLDLYLVPLTSADLDARHRDRLDADTRLRRRVYEMMLAAGNPRLVRLDGMVFERGVGEGGVERRDWVWERLVGLGVVRVTGDGGDGESEGEGEGEGEGDGRMRGRGRERERTGGEEGAMILGSAV